MAFVLKYWRVIAAVAGVIALLGGAGGLYAYVRHQGYVDGFTTAHQQCEDDKQKQETANQNAINEAAKKLTVLEQQLEIKDGQLDDYIKALDLAANAGPGSSDQCLDADSVRRLSAIQ